MKVFCQLFHITIIVGCLFSLSPVCAQSPERFKDPQPDDRPITYWMWLNGHITKAGITKDLEAMKAAGVNGTYMFSVGFYEPGPVKFMSEAWWDCVGHAIKESDRLHMSFGIYNSDGWSMSGGPWISAEESMKQITWADTLVSGGTLVNLRMPEPRKQLIYKDIAVLAFPAIKGNAAIAVDRIASSSRVRNSEALLSAGNANNMQFLKAAGKDSARLVVDFGHATDLRRVVFDEVKNNPFLEASARLEYSIDGKKYNNAGGSFPLNLKAEGLLKEFTFSFPKITARYIRISVSLEPSTKKPVLLTQDSITIGSIKFYASPRVHSWEPKSGQSKRIRHERQQIFIKELNSPVKEDLPKDLRVDSSAMINLTDMMSGDGSINWQAPAGRWIIQRIGYTSTNRFVSPATREGRGLECDKMDARAVEKHFNAYSGKIIDLSQKLVGKPVGQIQLESWEAGIQNWTGGFDLEFRKRNGYSIIPYLPVLAGGYVVNSYDDSEKFLWDFRNTIASMIAENYWGTMSRLAKARGVTVSGEGSGMQHYLYDPIRYQQYLDIPMGEFWPNEGHARADVKNASSVAHTLGRDLSGTESFTSGDENLWAITPFQLKQIADEAFTLGSNYFVLHTYVHQPYDVAPGFTLKHFGNHLQRLNPWYMHAQGWFNYISRSQYMLRQGKNIQDIAYFTGEGIPSYLGLPNELYPALAPGFDYDGVNLDILKTMSVRDGSLFLPSGATYRLLVFQDPARMTVELVREIKRLAGDGATIISPKPSGSPSLVDGKAAEEEIRKTIESVWGDIDGKKITQHRFGKGRICHGITPAQVLKELNCIPDFLAPGTRINYVHRQTADSDIYFLANYEDKPVNVKALFHVHGKMPQQWDPDKGIVVSLPNRAIGDQQMEVPVTLDPLGSVFIVFSKRDNAGIRPETPIKQTGSAVVKGPWDIQYMSANDSFKMPVDSLSDWTANTDERIKFFSGTAVYSTDIYIDGSAKRVELDLGDVRNGLVRVQLNGRLVADLWKPPYIVDLTSFAVPVENHLEISFTSTMVNALIGDERYPADLKYDNTSNVLGIPGWLAQPGQRGSKRKYFATYSYLKAGSPLQSSGLMGPLSLRYYKF